MSTAEPPTITVFVSSPGDVQEERKAVKRVLDRLNRMPAIARRYRFKPLLYEDGDVPPEGGRLPQTVIDQYLNKASAAGLYICILCHRFGTPLEDEQGEPYIAEVTGRQYLSGTEYEFLQAYRANQKAGTPDILLYRGVKPIPLDADPVQARRVKDFFQRFEGPHYDLKGLFQRYRTPEEFEELLFRHLEQKYGQTKVDATEIPSITGFVGREQENRHLRAWIGDDRCRVVSLVAGGGTGKSALAAVIENDLKQDFEYIFWRTLKNAPPLEDIAPQEGVLEQCLRFLSNFRLEELPKSVDDRIDLLLSYLRRRRCLLVLDNAETIMRTDQPDKFRDGYQAYGRLIQSIATAEHQSCLLLTSRQQPAEIKLLADQTGPVRSMQLTGLDDDDALKLLRRELGAEKWQKLYESYGDVSEAWGSVRRFYGGNPLSLKLVTGAVRQELDKAGGGHISGILQEYTHVPRTIMELLEQQIEPLPSTEQAILYWLAVLRESVSLPDLQAVLLPARMERETRAALAILQERFLVETSDSHLYTLQPVVMEFVTDRLIERIRAELDTGDLRLFSTHALITAQRTKEYVRNTQRRLILKPVLQHLRANSVDTAVAARLKDLLATLRGTQAGIHSYAAGNILNLLLQLQADLRTDDLLHGCDLSGLVVWEAFLQGATLHDVKFRGANLEKSVFTEPFGTILSVAFSPDGRLLVGGTGNGDILLWEADTGKPLDSVKGHSAEVWTLAFSPDGKLLASGSEDRVVTIHDVATRECLAILPHTHPIRSVAFRPDGNVLATGGEGKIPSRDDEDNTIRLYALTHDVRGSATWKHINTLRDHTAWIRSVAFSPDGNLLASGGEDQAVRLWDVSDPAMAHSPLKLDPEHGDKIRSVAFSPDGKTLASASEDKTIRLWSTARWGEFQTLTGHARRIRSIAFSPDSRRLVSGSDDTTVRIWDVTAEGPTSGQCLRVMPGHKYWIWSVAYGPDPKRPVVASGSEDQTVRLWDVESGECLYIKEGHTSWIRSVAFNTDGKTLGSGEDRLVRYWDIDSGSCLRTMPRDGHEAEGHTGWVRTVAFTPDGAILASCGEDHTIKLWDRDGHCVRTLLGAGNPVRAIAFNPAGTILAGAEDEVIRLWRFPRGPAHDPIQYDIVLEGHEGPIWALAFSPDGSLLASGGEDREVRLWDVVASKCLFRLPQAGQRVTGHTSWIRSLAFMPTAKMPHQRGVLKWLGLGTGNPRFLLASGGEDGVVCLWDTRNGTLHKKINGGGGNVRSVAFGPNGKPLASAEDRLVRLWDPRTGRLDGELEGHTDWVWSVAFSPNGKLLVSGSSDLTIKVWNLPASGSVVRECQRELRSVRPYEHMDIRGVRGLSAPQIDALARLGAIVE